MVEINIPKKREDTSIGRRLFAMAAPIAGGMIGGPAGAMAGNMLASKMNGASSQDALLGGAQQGADSAFSRRVQAKSQDPQMAVSDGLEVLKSLPQDHELRQKYAEPLIRAQMMGRPSISGRGY